jgi:hypothetical protein
MKIIEDTNTNEAIINGVRVQGCPSCNEWLESKWKNPNCGFCNSRLDKPLEEMSK